MDVKISIHFIKAMVSLTEIPPQGNLEHYDMPDVFCV